MKKIIKAALCFLPFVLAVVCINIYADPANVLRTDYEQQVADIMLSGRNAANLRNMDDRKLMRLLAAQRTQPIDTLVLGSSHSMQLTQEMTGDENTFVAGVTGADLRDCISIYQLFAENGFAPKRVILVADAWFLCEDTLEGRALTDGYTAFCKQNGLTPVGSGFPFVDKAVHLADKAGQAVSLPYLQSSLAYLRKGLQHARNPVPTDDFYAQTDVRRVDGSYGYNAALRDASPEDANTRVKDAIAAKPDFARNFTNVSAALCEQLAAFVRVMQQNGVEVTLVITPFHPAYYDYMAAQTDSYVQVLGTQQVLQTLADTLGVPLLGDYNPHALGMEAVDFIDFIHCKSEKLAEALPENLR